MKNNKRAGTLYIIVLIILIALSIVMMASVSFPRSQKLGGNNYHILIKHIMWLTTGVCVFGVLSIVDYRIYKKLKGYLYIVGIAMLVIVLFLGVEINGARRWITIIGFNFQPSEFVKIILIITLAGTIDLYKRKRGTHMELFLLLTGFTGLYAVLILAEKSFSSTIQIVGIGFTMIFISGVKLLPLLILSVMTALSGYIAIIKSPYRRARFFSHVVDKAAVYQLNQSLIAIGSGKLIGRFYGNGLQKYYYLPEIHTDYIFSGYAEELGFVGAVILIALYMILLGIIVYTIVKIKDRYAKYLLVGIFSMFSMQIIGNFLVVLGVLPSTGIPLPIMSYGGSSAIVTFASLGIVNNVIRKLSVSRNVETSEF